MGEGREKGGRRVRDKRRKSRRRDWGARVKGGGGGWKLVLDVPGSIYGSFGDVLSSLYTSTYLYRA